VSIRDNSCYFSRMPPKVKSCTYLRRNDIKNLNYALLPSRAACVSRRYFVFHTHAKNNAPSMIQMIVDVLIVVILKEMIDLPESHAEPPNESKQRHQSDVPDPQSEPLPPGQLCWHLSNNLHRVRYRNRVMHAVFRHAHRLQTRCSSVHLLIHRQPPGQLCGHLCGQMCTLSIIDRSAGPLSSSTVARIVQADGLPVCTLTGRPPRW
jgi:hypothetical protein